MENKITFEEQYNKIVNAYIKDELNPMDGCACFIGNLLEAKEKTWEYGRRFEKKFLSNEIKWVNSGYGEATAMRYISEISKGEYSQEEIYNMEINFLNKCYENPKRRIVLKIFEEEPTEESLFKAMESTLLMLKKIHEKKGEVIKPYNFEKRIFPKINKSEELQRCSRYFN